MFCLNVVDLFLRLPERRCLEGTLKLEGSAPHLLGRLPDWALAGFWNGREVKRS